MRVKISEFVRKIGVYIQHFFGFKPNIPINVNREDAKKDILPVSTIPEKLPALPLTNKYENIDWKNNPPQYRKRKGVLTFRERQFHRLLVSVIGRNHQILSMVRMADVLYLSNETEDRKFFNNNILCKHFDFVICDKLKFEPLLAIELDDSKHQFVFRKQVDEFKEKVCAEARLPLLRFQVQDKYDIENIGEQIRKTISNSLHKNE